MREQLVLTGVVLSAMPVGDFDKRVVMLTRERGKITAFARGARRQNSPLLAASNPFVFGRFFLYEGRTAYTLVQAEARNYFHELAQDFEGTCYASYFMEFADYYARENSEETQMVNLIYVSLKALLNPRLDQKLVRYVFELKTMVINGEYPEVFRCNCCGEEAGLTGYAPERNGLVCEACRKKIRGKFLPLKEDSVYALQYVVASPVEKLYTFTLSDLVFGEFQAVIDSFRKKYIEKSFKSLEILESIRNY